MPNVPHPTKTAATGKFTTHGEDFTCYLNKQGAPTYWVDSKSQVYGTDFVTTDGSTGLMQLQEQVNALSISGIPSDIDAGTF